MKVNMEHEHDKLDTALERRAVTIDILASEIKRKNQHIKYWREKAEYHRDYAVKFQEECEGLELKIYETEKELKKYKLADKHQKVFNRDKKRLANGHAKEFKK